MYLLMPYCLGWRIGVHVEFSLRHFVRDQGVSIRLGARVFGGSSRVPNFCGKECRWALCTDES